MFIELCGSEQATSSAIQATSKSKVTMSDKEFASTSFNSLSQELVNGTLKQQFKHDYEGTILSRLCRDYITNKSANCMFVCKVCPDYTKFKHSLTAIKFASKLYEVVRKRVRLTLPEQEQQNPEMFQTLSSRHSTFENVSDHQKYVDGVIGSTSKKSEGLSRFNTESDMSRGKSTEILHYLITDLDEFMSKPEYRANTNLDEWFEECQEKIMHIEDIIKRLPENAKSEFIESDRFVQLKNIMEHVRNKRKEYMHNVCSDSQPGIFEQSKLGDSKSSTHRSHMRNDSVGQAETINIKDGENLAVNSTGLPKSELDHSKQRRQHSATDNYEN